MVKEIIKRLAGFKVFDNVVMAVVSQSPNIQKIQSEIAEELSFKYDENTESGRARRLYGRLMEIKRILIVLDDVCLFVAMCPQMKEIVSKERREHETTSDIIAFPKLTKLTILRVPEFVGFYEANKLYSNNEVTTPKDQNVVGTSYDEHQSSRSFERAVFPSNPPPSTTNPAVTSIEIDLWVTADEELGDEETVWPWRRRRRRRI
ncbi:hypothetical protein GBA52_025089 [Prunus armeniaca]|nr:hypothetical protein GBA52_025089 [Prunus armeniaca]